MNRWLIAWSLFYKIVDRSLGKKRLPSLLGAGLLCFSLFYASLVPSQSASAQEEEDDGVSQSFLITTVSVRQGGEDTSTYQAGKPIEIIFRLNPHVDIPPGAPLHVELYNPDNNLIDSSTIYSGEEESPIATYSFTPQTDGDYTLAWSGTYGELSSEDSIRVKVRPSSEYTFEVDGKTATAIVDELSNLDFVRSVELNTEEKMLSITIDKMDYFTRFEVNVPYNLLSNPYIVHADGELIDIGDGPYNVKINKRADHAEISIPVGEGVSRFDIIGTTVIPEFPYHIY